MTTPQYVLVVNDRYTDYLREDPDGTSARIATFDMQTFVLTKLMPVPPDIWSFIKQDAAEYVRFHRRRDGPRALSVREQLLIDEDS